MEEQNKQWAIVSLMGHQQIVGCISEETKFGGVFLRVDVPETSKLPAYTKYFGASAIYSVDLVTEEIAKAHAEKMRQPVALNWDLRKLAEKHAEHMVNKLLAPVFKGMDEQKALEVGKTMNLPDERIKKCVEKANEQKEEDDDDMQNTDHQYDSEYL